MLVDWDNAARIGDHLRSSIDPNDVDGTKNRLIDRIHWQALKRELPRSGRLLDVGCGVGRLAQRVSALGLDYTGADTSREMIEVARTENVKSSARFIHFSDGRMPFAAAEFDQIITVMVYQHVIGGPDERSFASELRRVIRDDGKLIMLEQASLSGQRSNSVTHAKTPEDYVKALSPYFQVGKVSRIRTSQFSRPTHKLLAVAGRSGIAKRFALPIAATIESEKARIRGNAYFRSVPYFDMLILATPSR